MEIKEIDFNTIEDIWISQKDMWIEKPFIRPIQDNLYWDGIQYFGGKNKLINSLKYSNPYYYACFISNKIVGVNSFFKVNNEQCRSRGLYVFPEYRNKGISKLLLNYAIEKNKNKNYKFIWTMPRKEALSSYTSIGFYKTSNFFSSSPDRGMKMISGYENCYARFDFQ